MGTGGEKMWRGERWKEERSRMETNVTDYGVANERGKAD